MGSIFDGAEIERRDGGDLSDVFLMVAEAKASQIAVCLRGGLCETGWWGVRCRPRGGASMVGRSGVA